MISIGEKRAGVEILVITVDIKMHSDRRPYKKWRATATMGRTFAANMYDLERTDPRMAPNRDFRGGNLGDSEPISEFIYRKVIDKRESEVQNLKKERITSCT